MKSKVSQTSSQKNLSQIREQKEDTSALVKREITRLIASKLNIGNVQKLSMPIYGKVASSGTSRLYEKSSMVIPQSKIIVRSKDSSKDIDVVQHVRSKSMNILPTQKDVTSGSKFSSIRHELERQNEKQPLIWSTEQATKSTKTHKQLVKQYGIDQSRVSTRSVGVVKAYGANTHKGIVRNYNQDRVSIVTNFDRERSMLFFAVYDGHGGNICADYLKDNMHLLVSKQLNLTRNIKEALTNAVYLAEYNVLKNSEFVNDFSGSCALIAIVKDTTVYVVNVGDCRAIACESQGKSIIQLTNDHKPGQPAEQQRITKAGGTVYQTKSLLGTNPHRVLPGRLSVSRTIGDLEAKAQKYGGKKNIVIAEPEIVEYQLTDKTDFLLLASDGVYDKLSNNEIARVIYNNTVDQSTEVHHTLGRSIEAVMIEGFNRQATDNVSIVMIAFDAFCKKIDAVAKVNKHVIQPQQIQMTMQETALSRKPSPRDNRDRSSSNLASYRRLQTVREVLRRNLSSKK